MPDITVETTGELKKSIIIPLFAFIVVTVMTIVIVPLLLPTLFGKRCLPTHFASTGKILKQDHFRALIFLHFGGLVSALDPLKISFSRRNRIDVAL